MNEHITVSWKTAYDGLETFRISPQWWISVSWFCNIRVIYNVLVSDLGVRLVEGMNPLFYHWHRIISLLIAWQPIQSVSFWAAQQSCSLTVGWVTQLQRCAQEMWSAGLTGMLQDKLSLMPLFLRLLSLHLNDWLLSAKAHQSLWSTNQQEQTHESKLS